MADAEIKEKIKACKAEIVELNDQLKAKSKAQQDGSIAGSGSIKPVKKTRDMKGHFGKAMSISFGDTLMASSGQDGFLIVWDPLKAVKKCMAKLPSQFAMMSAITADGSLACAGGLNNVVHMHKCDGKTLTFMHDMEGHDGYVPNAHFISNSKLLSCSGDATLAIWDTSNASAPVSKIEGHAADVGSVDFSTENNDLYVSCSNDTTTRFWDGRSGKCTGIIRFTAGDELSKVKFVPGQSNTAAVSVAGEGKGENHGKCIVLDLRSMAKLKTLNGTSDEALSLAFSNSGRLLFAGNSSFDQDFKVYDVTGGSDPLKEYKSGDDRCNDVTITKDGMGVATANWDTTIKLWSV